MNPVNRRAFLATSASLLTGASVLKAMPHSTHRRVLFKISLAEWSLHKELFAKKLDNLDFAKVARSFGIDAVEYVNSFFKAQVGDAEYLKELKTRAEGEGVASLLIMCDGLGDLGDADEQKRKTAVANHAVWLDAAKYLGCHSIRVNAASSGSYDEQMKRAADGLRQLTDLGAARDLNVIVENHGGLSSNGKWLAAVIKKVDHPRCGTLPDFGNFRLQGDEWYDRYQGVEELMPFAKAVSAKSHDFDAQGNETKTDYARMLAIVVKAGYGGFVGIEYEGDKLGEREGIVATKKLLERVRDELEQAARAEAGKDKAPRDGKRDDK